MCFFFKQKTAYEMRISDWSSDVCSSDLRSELKKRISENTLNKAVQLMGYEGRLTGHGIRGTISTALNEIGYPKIWVDAQLSHSDPNKVSRSEERRVGKAGVSTGRSRWSQSH